ncbi:MFS transporter [Desulfitobacterium chlororespirans]|uniref:Predicted arabinose efflux permease, MFS family n=1 Tax=Desulfitobacterium chlororespirans DSM 11544 TaxID=1121395 RepID=A0A1M7SPT1_9FIRM|nr:MFS transporter [Desulfitobacterium chlororespirans]SHN60444.1 Predicted arabinose efflux permease, MFS family [Desulfitobacterium chlororespirans DSM 11544]
MCSEQPARECRDFIILLISAFFIYTYNNIFMVVTPVLLARMGGSDMIMGLQSTLFLAAAVILRFFFGPLADVRGRRFVMLLGSASFLLASVMLCYAGEVWQVVLLRLLQAVGLASYFPAASATAATCGGRDKKGQYIGILRMVASLSLMVGPVFALYIIQNYRYPLFFQGTAWLALLGMLPIFLISLKKVGPPQEAIQREMNLRQRLKLRMLLKKCPLIISNTFAAALIYGILISFAVLFLKDETKISNPGYFFTLFSLGGILGNLGFGWLSDRWGRLPINSWSFLLLGSGIVLFSIIPQVPLCFYPAGLFSGAGYFGSIAVLMAWMTEKAELNERTTALSLQQNALDMGIAAGSGMFGILLAAVGNAAWLYGTLGMVWVGYAFIVSRYKRV